MKRRLTFGLVIFVGMLFVTSCGDPPVSVDVDVSRVESPVADRGEIPKFKVDPWWPKQLPDQWVLGWGGGLVVDPNDHVWIVHVGNELTGWETKGGASDPPTTLCCKPAPPVIEFDQEGNVVQAWGGPGPGYDLSLIHI